MIPSLSTPKAPCYYLMASFGAKPPLGGEPDPDVRSHRQQRRVVIIEDELLAAFALEAMFEEIGYQVDRIFSCGEDALAELEHLDVDLICVDVNLGQGIDGVETARQIRFRRAGPVLFITAYSDAATKTRISQAVPGAGIIGKPISKDALMGALTGLIERPN